MSDEKMWAVEYYSNLYEGWVLYAGGLYFDKGMAKRHAQEAKKAGIGGSKFRVRRATPEEAERMRNQ